MVTQLLNVAISLVVEVIILVKFIRLKHLITRSVEVKENVSVEQRLHLKFF